MNETLAYMTSFGAKVPTGTRYQEVDMKSIISGNLKYSIDLRNNMFGENNEILAKSLSSTTGGAGTAGYVLSPIYLDQRIVDLTRKETPLVELFPRVTNLGMKAVYDVISAKNGGGFYAEGETFVGAAADTYSQASKDIKFLKVEGEVTGQAVAGLPAYVLAQFEPTGAANLQNAVWKDQTAGNAMQLEVLVKTRKFREIEENAIINGDSTSDPKSFDGFIKLIGTNNQKDMSHAAFDMDYVNIQVSAAWKQGGHPNLAVCSAGIYTAIVKTLTALIRYTDVTKTVAWGFQTVVLYTSIGEIPVIQSRFLDDTTNNKSIWFLDMSVVEMRVLQDLTYEELGKVKDARPFFLKAYECLIVRAPQFCASIIGVA
jgi:hypothetical protein